MVRRGSRRVVLVLAITLAVAACDQPAAQGPLLSDPREILSRGIDVTSTIRSVHLRADVTVQMGIAGQPVQAPESVTLDADVDFTSGNLAASGVANGRGDRMGVIIVNGTTFNLDTNTGRWQQMPAMAGPGAGGLFGLPIGRAGGPDVKTIVQGLVSDEQVATELIAVDPCGGARCYRVRVTIPPQVLWDTAMDLLGMGNAGIGGQLGQMPPGLPALSTELLFETASVVLVEGRIGVSMDGTTLNATIGLSNHDQPIAIQPPPPQLIDRFDEKFIPPVG
jgi:hypothetical protein